MAMGKGGDRDENCDWWSKEGDKDSEHDDGPREKIDDGF